MKIFEAQPIIQKVIGIPFKELYSELELDDIVVAKGRTGQLLEKIIELSAYSHNNDFEDGELKTNKTDEDGNPIETMFISQIKSHVDELFMCKPFSDSWIYNKIKRLLYVPVVKKSKDPNEWYFLSQYFVEIRVGSILYLQLEEDYNSICNQMITSIEKPDGFLHTSSGKYIQIRTKDSKPYSSIYSSKYNRFVTNKNFAFYFKKDFMKDVQKKFGLKYGL